MKKSILMVAAENDALPNAKVGGIGDVIRDIPPALAQLDCSVNVVLPSYGYLHTLPGAEEAARFPVRFAGKRLDVTAYALPAKAMKNQHLETGVKQWVLHHEDFAPCGERVYCDDGDDRPFATDAKKYAFFCAAVSEAILRNTFGELDILHLHDWHSALLAVLRAYDPNYSALKSLPVVYTIHNLALQGVRPFSGDDSSLEQWFPSLRVEFDTVCDPNYPQCVNPMRAAINLADKVHAVSPSYAQEIQKPSDRQKLIYGGEGLEADLAKAASENRLIGVLNGCTYNAKAVGLSKAKLASVVWHALLGWVAKSPVMQSSHWLAEQRLKQWIAGKERGFLMTSVGRLTEQKAALMRQVVTYKQKRATALDHLLTHMQGSGMYILLGSGNADYESFMREVSARHQNFIFLQGYNEALAEAVYSSGDLFIMPSSFEPCGISQMLAMRAGQPCVVNAVGGLKDTVEHLKNGFIFSGNDGQEQALAFISTTLDAMALAKSSPNQYRQICKNAATARFEWTTAAESYIANLYS